jgi:TRAP-type C4-dicarboxylate transport system substrate-binding protein
MTPLSRRALLRAGSAATVAAALPLRAQSTTTLKFHSFWPGQSEFWRTKIIPWTERVAQESGGRLRIVATPDMKLGGSPAQLYDQAREGSVADIVATLPGYTPGRFPRSEVFELPFMMSNAEVTSLAYWDYLQTAAPNEFKDVQLLTANVHGPGVIHTTAKRIHTVEDLRGLKLRSPTRQVDRLLTFLGVQPVNMPLPGIAPALASGSINGCVVPWEISPAIKLPELCKYHAEFATAGGSLYTSTFVMVMNKAKYASLPPELRKVIDSNSGPLVSASLGKTQQSMDAAGRRGALEHGNSIETLDIAEAQKFKRLSRLVEVEWAEDVNRLGYNGYKLLDTARKLIERYPTA